MFIAVWQVGMALSALWKQLGDVRFGSQAELARLDVMSALPPIADIRGSGERPLCANTDILRAMAGTPRERQHLCRSYTAGGFVLSILYAVGPNLSSAVEVAGAERNGKIPCTSLLVSFRPSASRSTR